MNIFDDYWRFETNSISYKAQTAYGPRIQSALQLVYIYEGKVDIYIDKEPEYSVQANEIALLLPGHRELFQFEAGTHHGWSYAMNESYSESLLQKLSNRPKAIGMTNDMHAIDRMIRSHSEEPNQIKRAIQNHLIAALFYEYFRETNCIEEEPSKVLHPAIHKAQTFIRKNLQQELELESITQAAGVSSTHLIRLFKQSQLETPIRYLWKQRLEKSAYLMKETGLTAAEVAERCGFRNPQHFSKAFHNYFSITPRQMRLKTWKIR